MHLDLVAHGVLEQAKLSRRDREVVVGHAAASPDALYNLVSEHLVELVAANLR